MAIFILLLPLAFSVYGGETWSYHFDKCDTLRVNITAIDKIDNGEYTILNNCTKNQTNYYICECDNDYDFNVTFEINAVNSYTFYFNYNYSQIITGGQQSSGGGGGGSSSHKTIEYISDWNCTGWTDCQPNNKATRNCTSINNDSDVKPYEERGCYFYIPKEEQPKIDEPVEEPVIDSYIEVVNISTGVFNETWVDTLEEPKTNYIVLLLLVILLIISIIIIFIVYNR